MGRDFAGPSAVRILPITTDTTDKAYREQNRGGEHAHSHHNRALQNHYRAEDTEIGLMFRFALSAGDSGEAER
jgi:hypothetical protein